MKYTIIDKKTGKELDYSKYAINAYGDVICLTNGLVLLDNQDFIIDVVPENGIVDYNKKEIQVIDLSLIYPFEPIIGMKYEIKGIGIVKCIESKENSCDEYVLDDSLNCGNVVCCKRDRKDKNAMYLC